MCSFFPFRVDSSPFPKGGKSSLIVASPESVFIPLKHNVNEDSCRLAAFLNTVCFEILSYFSMKTFVVVHIENGSLRHC